MSTKLATVIADFTTQLTTELDIGGTIATLKSATDDDAVALPAGTYFFTIDGANSQKEHIVCTLSGTALTAIQSVSRQGVETSGAARLHRVGASVTITDFAHLYFINAIVGGRALLDSSYPLEYDGSPTLTGANQLMTRSAVLALVNGGPVSFNEVVVSGTAGETFSSGAPVYLKASDSRWYKLLANDSQFSSLQNIQIGIALGAGSAGVAITGGIALSGVVATLSGLTANNLYYLSDTGTLSLTPGTYSVPLGWALSTTSLLFNPKYNLNKIIIADNLTQASTDQVQATQDTAYNFGSANTTGLRNKLAQSFIPARGKIKGTKLYKSADSGTFTGTVKIALQADSSGAPSGSDLASVTITNAQWLNLAAGEFEADFSSEYGSLSIGSLYWIVASASTADSTNHPNINGIAAGAYANGSMKYNNTTDGWVAIANADLYFKTLEGVASQVAETNSSGLLPDALIDKTATGMNLQQFIGNGSPSVVRKWVVAQLPFIGSFLKSNGGTPAYTDLWTFSIPSGTPFSLTSLLIQATSGAAAYASFPTANLYDPAGSATSITALEFTLSFMAAFKSGGGGGTSSVNAGLGSNIGSTTMIYNPTTTYSFAGFTIDTSDNLYAVTANGAAGTQVQIKGITLTAMNEFFVDVVPGVSATFYINGVQVAVITTNVPTAANMSSLLFGRSIVSASFWNDSIVTPVLGLKLIA